MVAENHPALSPHKWWINSGSTLMGRSSQALPVRTSLCVSRAVNSASRRVSFWRGMSTLGHLLSSQPLCAAETRRTQRTASIESKHQWTPKTAYAARQRGPAAYASYSVRLKSESRITQQLLQQLLQLLRQLLRLLRQLLQLLQQLLRLLRLQRQQLQQLLLLQLQQLQQLLRQQPELLQQASSSQR